MTEPAPEADAVEQATALEDEPADPRALVPPAPVEADDADVWEQAVEVPPDDDDWR